MKRYGNLFEKIITYENLLLAHRNARKGKSHYSEVKMVNANEDFYIKEIQKSLINQTFTTSEYTIFDKFDGRKQRTLYKLPYFPDRIVQHAICQICGPIWTKSLIRDTFQSIKKRGTHDARKRVEKTIRNNPNLYALKFDIKKYYPSVNNTKLKQEIRRKIKCQKTLALLDNIIDSSQGIPIGNLTSQFFGNLYLSTFDWWIKQEVKPIAYFRYCDDIVVIDSSSTRLHSIKHQCFDKLKTEYHLEVKPNHQVFSVDKSGLDFVGFVFRSNQVKLRKTIAKKIKDKFRSISKQNAMTYSDICGIFSYWGWCKHISAKKFFFENLRCIEDVINRFITQSSNKPIEL